MPLVELDGFNKQLDLVFENLHLHVTVACGFVNLCSDGTRFVFVVFKGGSLNTYGRLVVVSSNNFRFNFFGHSVDSDFFPGLVKEMA